MFSSYLEWEERDREYWADVDRQQELVRSETDGIWDYDEEYNEEEEYNGN